MNSRKRAHSDSTDVIEVKDEADEDCVEVQDLTQDTEEVQMIKPSPIIIIVDDIPTTPPVIVGSPELTISEPPELAIAAVPESDIVVTVEPAIPEAPEPDTAAAPESGIVVTVEPEAPELVIRDETAVSELTIVPVLEPSVVVAVEAAVVEDISVPDTIVVGKDDSMQGCENANVINLEEPTPAPSKVIVENQEEGASIQIAFRDQDVFDFYSDLVIELLSQFKELVWVKIKYFKKLTGVF